MMPLASKHNLLRLFGAHIVLLFILLGLAINANAFEATHALDIQLNPSRARLDGIDRITVTGHSGPVKLYMGKATVIDRLTLNGVETDYARRGGWITVERPASLSSQDLQLSIHYHGRFDDPAPDDPVNTDNPGFGVTGTISPRGTLLLAGAGWYPSVAGAAERFRLQVTGPPGIVAVTAGRAVPAAPRQGFTVSAWQIDNPVERLALVAGRFKVRTQTAGHLVAATYFLNDDRELADQYLKASLQYLADYETLFGPYPFAKFAVVENFFPTGYGFPSFTLIGGRVLRLPFIIPTSLRHEIAHCWWGNGVLVDYADGNWSEGLTTYVSDYRYRELTGADAARDSRRQMLRNFTELVPSGEEFPLIRFTSRRDPLTKAIGYDKAAMVFHMLRQHVGDPIFWSTLKRIAGERMFKATSWEDIQAAFESACDCSLDVFFRQWVRRTGAPQLSLDAIRRDKTPTGARIRGIIRQRAPVFALELPIKLSHAADAHTEKIIVDKEQTRFDIQIPFSPQRVEVDPAFDFFRRLAPGNATDDQPAQIGPGYSRGSTGRTCSRSRPRDRIPLRPRSWSGADGNDHRRPVVARNGPTAEHCLHASERSQPPGGYGRHRAERHRGGLRLECGLFRAPPPYLRRRPSAPRPPGRLHGVLSLRPGRRPAQNRHQGAALRPLQLSGVRRRAQCGQGHLAGRAIPPEPHLAARAAFKSWQRGRILT